MNEAADQNWPVRVLERQINSGSYERPKMSQDKKPVVEEMLEKTAPLAATPRDDDAPVSFDRSWDNDFTVSVVPSSNLLFNTVYRLRVLDGESRKGRKFIPDGKAEATFRVIGA